MRPQEPAPVSEGMNPLQKSRFRGGILERFQMIRSPILYQALAPNLQPTIENFGFDFRYGFSLSTRETMLTDIARSLQIFGPSGSVYSPPCKHEDSIAYGVRLFLCGFGVLKEEAGGGNWRGGVWP